MNSTTARFWRNVQIPDDTGACWQWRGYGTAGYGQLFVNPGKVYAHRFSYELAGSPIPAGMVLDHLCGNRGCVNPAHLEVVTLAENTRRSRCAAGRASVSADTPALLDPQGALW